MISVTQIRQMTVSTSVSHISNFQLTTPRYGTSERCIGESGHGIQTLPSLVTTLEIAAVSAHPELQNPSGSFDGRLYLVKQGSNVNPRPPHGI